MLNNIVKSQNAIILIVQVDYYLEQSLTISKLSQAMSQYGLVFWGTNTLLNLLKRLRYHIQASQRYFLTHQLELPLEVWLFIAFTEMC